MSQQAVRTWLFGKLPSLGDFVSRGMSQAMRDDLDGWLMQEMESARASVGDDFAALYDAAPAWNFVDCSKEGRWSGGALCASQDRAGRRFPLIMGAEAADIADAVAVSVGCLSAMYRAFVEAWDADALVHAPLDPEPVEWHPQGPEWALLAEDGPAMILPGSYPRGAITLMVGITQ